jgi:hypothetical protein
MCQEGVCNPLNMLRKGGQPLLALKIAAVSFEIRATNHGGPGWQRRSARAGWATTGTVELAVPPVGIPGRTFLCFTLLLSHFRVKPTVTHTFLRFSKHSATATGSVTARAGASRRCDCATGSDSLVKS